MKRFRIVIAVLLTAVFCAFTIGCSSVGKDADTTGTKVNGPSYSSGMSPGDAVVGHKSGVIPQGGSLIQDNISGDSASSVEITETEFPNDENELTTPGDSGDTSYSTFQEMRPNVTSPQFNRQSYETLQPTEEYTRDAIEGYFMIEGAEFVSDECRLMKGDRFETYELLLMVDGVVNYQSVVDTYADRLREGYDRKDWTTKTGNATSFRIEHDNWNKVISIFRRDHEPDIEIRVTFRRLFDN